MLGEISRILRLGGSFVSVSCEDPVFPLPVFDELGFSARDKKMMASTAGIYAGSENLCEIVLANGLKTITNKKITSQDGRIVILFVFEKE